MATDELGLPLDLPTLQREARYVSRRAGALMTWAAAEIESLRADRDRLREENKRNADELDRVAADHSRVVNELSKLREEIAAKDAEIRSLKAALESFHNAGRLQMRAATDKAKTCAPMEDWRGANEDWRKR